MNWAEAEVFRQWLGNPDPATNHFDSDDNDEGDGDDAKENVAPLHNIGMHWSPLVWASRVTEIGSLGGHLTKSGWYPPFD